MRTSFEGFHRYPDAPQEVAFLRGLHRHQFVVRIWVEQFNNDRDVEYISLLRWVNARIAETRFPEEASCEAMAQELGRRVAERHPDREIRVEVSEDDENGALVELAPAAR